MKRKKRFVGVRIDADLADRIGAAAKNQGRCYSEEIEARLRPFYFKATGGSDA